ncbi:MAG: beta strand repeat-containing protein, partial [Deltaproteobacteria bacterium]
MTTLVVVLVATLVVAQVPARLLPISVAMPAQIVPAALAAGGFDAAFFGESLSHLVVARGQSVQFTVEYANTGATPWVVGSSSEVDLAVCDAGACNVASPNAAFANGWLSATRYATSSTSAVASGAVASFTWSITVPATAAAGVYVFRGDLVTQAGELVHPSFYEARVLVADGTLTVNTTSDATSLCNTDVCSLRGAIVSANATAGALIRFAIPNTTSDPGPAHTIALTAGLPAITAPTWIDGWTQGGLNYIGPPLVEIDGSGSGIGTAPGLVTRSDAILLRGLAVTGFVQGPGVLVSGAGTELFANYIGVHASGGAGANKIGVVVQSSNNIVGARSSEHGNVISANLGDGLRVARASVDQTVTGNRIGGNLIGTDPTGASALGNGNDGLAVVASGGNLIGGAQPFERNVISANQHHQLVLGSQGAGGEIVLGNTIGADKSGLTDISSAPTAPGGGVGIQIESPNNTIGTPGAGNLIVGNGTGIFLGPDGGGAGTPNGNVIAGNSIGVGSDGVPLGNDFRGIHVLGSNNRIGGDSPGEGNTIANNGASGIVVDGSAGAGDHNAIIRNSITANGNKGIRLLSGGNDALEPPTVDNITFGSFLAVSGTGRPGALVSVYSDPVSSTAGQVGDEGQTFHTAVLADGNGNWTVG